MCCSFPLQFYGCIPFIPRSTLSILAFWRSSSVRETYNPSDLRSKASHCFSSCSIVVGDPLLLRSSRICLNNRTCSISERRGRPETARRSAVPTRTSPALARISVSWMVDSLRAAAEGGGGGGGAVALRLRDELSIPVAAVFP